MSFKKKKKEIKRLIKAFEIEAQRFHDLKFSIFTITQATCSTEKFKQPNHAILLWQYYGQKDSENFIQNLKHSDLKWGIRGAELSSYGLIEGDKTDLFTKMATRAGCIFNKKEAYEIKTKTIYEIREKKKEENLESIVVVNDNPLAIWLNYLLYYISTVASNEETKLIHTDPFTLSMFALEQLLDKKSIEKVDKSVTKLEDIQFDVSFSFPGERRKFVSSVADIIRKKLNKNKLFYDFDYQAQLARPNIDSLLQKIYRNNSKLIVVFLSSEYSEKEWCGLEWRAIRDIIKSKDDEKIMFIRFDNTEIDGLFSIDGYIDANKYNEKEIAKFILERIQVLNT
jgi:hypothetical protein